jgi:F-type H+-transporting ATPase subunit b
MALFDTTFLASQLFWTALSFIVLLGVMWKYVVPAVASVLDERAERIRLDLAKAEEMRNDAQNLLEQYEASLATARKESAEIVAAAKQQADAMWAQKTLKLENELKQRADEAAAQLEAAKQKAMKDLQSEVSKLVVTAAEKVLRDSVDAKKAEALTTKALKDLH